MRISTDIKNYIRRISRSRNARLVSCHEKDDDNLLCFFLIDSVGDYVLIKIAIMQNCDS